MDNHKLKKVIIIKTNSVDEMDVVRKEIHAQLIGNIDYIESRIILNGTDDRIDDTTNEVHVYIFEDCTPVNLNIDIT